MRRAFWVAAPVVAWMAISVACVSVGERASSTASQRSGTPGAAGVAHELHHLPGHSLVSVSNEGGDGLHRVGAPGTPAHPFDRLLVSWNVAVGAEGAFEVEVQVMEAGRPSPWLWLGSGGGADRERTTFQTSFAGGAVDVDAFRAAAGHRFESARVRLRTRGEVRPERLSLCFTWSRPELDPQLVGLAEPDGADAEQGPSAPQPGATALSVPQRSQRDGPADVASRLCSPTSVAMVLAYHGVEVPTAEVARRAFDPWHDLYGNWPRAIQAAYSLGVPGYVARFDGFEPVRALVARGLPVILSVRVAEGELRGAPYTSTAGHLLVVTGFDGDEVLVNDPAATQEEGVARRYDRAELSRAWLGHGGVAYVLGE